MSVSFHPEATFMENVGWDCFTGRLRPQSGWWVADFMGRGCLRQDVDSGESAKPGGLHDPPTESCPKPLSCSSLDSTSGWPTPSSGAGEGHLNGLMSAGSIYCWCRPPKPHVPKREPPDREHLWMTERQHKELAPDGLLKTNKQLQKSPNFTNCCYNQMIPSCMWGTTILVKIVSLGWETD